MAVSKFMAVIKVLKLMCRYVFVKLKDLIHKSIFIGIINIKKST